MKLPAQLATTQPNQVHRFAIWCANNLTAVSIAGRLQKMANEKRHTMPAAGAITYKGVRYYWCNLQALHNPSTYAIN